MDKLNTTEKENLKCLFVYQEEQEDRLKTLEEQVAGLKRTIKIEAFKLNHLLKHCGRTEMKKRTLNINPKY